MSKRRIEEVAFCGCGTGTALFPPLAWYRRDAQPVAAQYRQPIYSNRKLTSEQPFAKYLSHSPDQPLRRL